jgi:hypothetical protein
MENSEKGLRAEVTTNYLRLTDAAIRAATLPAWQIAALSA